jgi:NTP pyrophosphatase (non-canonical NTP hydrolase)
MNTQEQIELVRDWGRNKGIIGPNGKATEQTQYVKLVEEVDEFREAMIENCIDEKIDAIGDCAVVLILLSEIIGVSFEDCLESAYNVIKSRTGQMIDGAFVKDK